MRKPARKPLRRVDQGIGPVGSCMCSNKSPFGGFLPKAQNANGNGMNTITHRSFRLTSSPPSGIDSTRWVRACDQANSGDFEDGAVAACGKPKFRGSRDGSAGTDPLAARSNSAAQSIGG